MLGDPYTCTITQAMSFNLPLSRLFGKRNLRLPKTSDEIGDYTTNFERAAEFTASCGFPMSKIVWHQDISLDKSGDFIEPAMRVAGVHDPSKSAAQCLKWCHYIAPAFENQLGCKVWVTLGQIWKGDQAVFGPTWEDMKRWGQIGIQLDDFRGRMGLNLHAWLTVDTGEIIDLTFLSSLAAICGGEYAKFAGATVWGRDPHVLNNHRYFPMAIGREFVEAIGNKSVVPLLAINSAELHQFTAMLVPD